MKQTNPPSLATKLLESLVPQRTSEALLGDLIEQYEGGRSRTWYWQQVILALVISAGREGRIRKLQAVRAIVIGYLTGASLCYFTTSLAGRFVGPTWGSTRLYLVFLPLAFFSAAASGWIVRRSHPRAMVLVWAGFCVVASVVAFAVCAWLSVLDRMPAPSCRFLSLSTSSSRRSACWREGFGVRLVQTIPGLELQRFVAMGAGEQHGVFVWRLLICESRDAFRVRVFFFVDAPDVGADRTAETRDRGKLRHERQHAP